jgi:FtsH-binding integral membrane protein
MDIYAGNPVVLIFQALGLMGLSVTGMVAYLLTGPKQLNWLGAGLATIGLPMLVLMVVSFLFPIGGFFGILISLAFVAVSAGGLLYNLNLVMHQMNTRMVIPAAFAIAMSTLVLFWNILVLLMKLQGSRR